MSFDPSRLRRGEVVAGLSAIALLAFEFLTPWYGLTGRAELVARAHDIPTSVNAFNGLTVIRWLLLVTVAVTLLLVYLQGSRRAPALPASLSVIVLVLATVTVVVLVYRVLLDVPQLDIPTVSDQVQAQAGAYLALVSALVLTYGAFSSLREEDQADPVRNAQIPTIHVRR